MRLQIFSPFFHFFPTYAVAFLIKFPEFLWIRLCTSNTERCLRCDHKNFSLLLKLIQFFYILIVTLSPCIHGFHDFWILFVKFVRDPDRFLSRFHITMLSGKHDDQFVAALLQSKPEWDRICDSYIQIIMPSELDRFK